MLSVRSAICFILLLFSVGIENLQAQFNNFKKWTVKDGLMQSDIYDIRQDSRGYLWIGTGGGAMQYDGLKFRYFTKTNGLAGNTVRCIFEDTRGRIWFGTNEGVCYYNGSTFASVRNKTFKGSSALCFAEDDDHNIYIGTDDGGLNVLTFTGDSLQVKNISETNGLGSNSIFDIAIDKEKNIWLATYGGGLALLSKKAGEFSCKNIRGAAKLPSDILLCVEISDEELWIGSYDAGAVKFLLKDLINESYDSREIFNTKNGLSSDCIWDLLISRDKKVWLGTLEHGITRLEKKPVGYTTTVFNSENGLSDNQVLSLYEDRQQNVWIGTNGNGMNRFSGDYFSHYSTSDGLQGNKVQAITQDSTGALWLTSSSGGLTELRVIDNKLNFNNYTDKTGLTYFISSIAIGKAGNRNIWFGTDDKGLVKFNGKKFYNYTEKDGLINNRVYAVYVDSRGIVWTGTADGISRFDGVRFLNISTDKMKMQNEGVKAIVEDQAQTLWFGTSGGLARYKGEGDLRTFDEVEGLRAKDVNALAAHPSGDIYIGTNTGGLYRYNHLKNDTAAIEFVMDERVLLSNSIRSLQFINDSVLIAGTFRGFDKIWLGTKYNLSRVKHYTQENGFTGMECNDNAILFDDAENVWFGTVNGITRYTPRLDNKAVIAPEVFITDVQLFSQDVDWQKKRSGKQSWFNVPNELVLPFYENHVTFKFHANDFNNSENIVYKFMLAGRDKDWSPPRKNSEEPFSGLEPGSYEFMVMAQNQDGIWSKPASFRFVITPPWYRTTLFYILVLLFIILSVYGYIKWREKKLIKEKHILEQTVKERTHEVEVQKEHLAEKNKEITDSINYAKGIQSSMLPPMSEIHAAWKDLFVFFQPKDIVSGDFYWFKQINENEFLIACADCTGHGVPGGFMSMICSDRLHDAVKETTEPALILNKTNNGVKTSLRQQTHVEGKSKDGMEICLLRINTQTQNVSYSGANRLLWLVDGETKELTEIKPTKASIASFTEFDFEYQQTDLVLKKGDLLYTTSDGYPDQFGGTDGKKYMSKNLKNLIVQNCHLPMAEQLAFFRNDINSWMQGFEQVDDLLVIGIRL